MTDLTKSMEPKSDQLIANDLVMGPRTIKITKITVNDKLPSQKVSVFFEGDNGKPWKPCKGMISAMCQVWDTVESSNMVGKSLTLFREPTVLWGGADVGGIQISNASHIDKPKKIRLRISRTKSVTFTMHPLVVDDTSDVAEKAKELARNYAEKGSDVFNKWWNTDEGKKSRAFVDDIMDELKATVAKFEANNEEPL